MTDAVVERVKQRAHEGQIPCTAAHTAAWETGVSPAEVGAVLNEIGLAVDLCQLGLFGYGPKAEHKSKLLRPMAAIDPELRSRIEARAGNRVISCLDCWEIADALRIERLAVGNAADAMGIKIRPCQLGCF